METSALPRMLTIPESAEYLRSSVKFVRSLIWSRTLPYIRAGKRYVIDREDIDRWIERTKHTM
jgi:excisionase family DNA binding protein